MCQPDRELWSATNDTYNHIIVRVAMLVMMFLRVSFFASLVESDFTTSRLIDESSRATAVSMFYCQDNKSITGKL